ncbi:MAG: hypothetical protein A2W07_03920 [candidate division Zixibacteria bacterium RBG_16_43_9]|nr:MAG: hypothetical protein A2W07_03920 [candidate division Zixibacteria bacterium RBG_16_43_9]
MPLLTRQDWETLRKEEVAFERMQQKHFEKLLDKVYGNPGSTARTELDDIDALMVYLARTEPPIPPPRK